MIVAPRRITRRRPLFIATTASRSLLNCGLPKVATADPVTDDGRALITAIGENDFLSARTICRRGKRRSRKWICRWAICNEALRGRKLSLAQADDRLIDLLMENGADQEGDVDYFDGRYSSAFMLSPSEELKRRGAESHGLD